MKPEKLIHLPMPACMENASPTLSLNSRDLKGFSGLFFSSEFSKRYIVS